MLSVNASGAKAGASVMVLGLDGRKVVTGALNAGAATLDLRNVEGGVYLVKVDGFGAKKVVLR